MTQISHHLSDDLIDAYATGALPRAFAVVAAAHLSLCDACRARAEASAMLGGALMDRLNPVAVGSRTRERVMAALDAPMPPVSPTYRRSGIFPGPIMEALDGHPPKWSLLGGGIRQQILHSDPQGSLRLLYIPPGRAVPEHGHRGLELTLVLQGSFSDSEGAFGPGDLEVAENELNHQPTAGHEAPCICVAATDAPLRFHSLIPRLLQPVFKI